MQKNESSSEKTPERLLEEIREVIDWANGLGVRLPKNNTWIERAANRIEDLLAANDTKHFAQIYDDPIEAQNNIADLNHMLFIRQNIGNQDIAILRQKLELAMTGPDSVRLETPGNTMSRDARFELYVCAGLNVRHFKAKLYHPNPDIYANKKDVRAAIECKRVFSEKRLEKLILEAARQLRDRVGNRNTDLRIVYCDITRVITDGRSHLQGPKQDVLDDLIQELNKWGEWSLELFRRRHIIDSDMIVLVYQDYIESNDGEYRLSSVTQQLAVINPILKRRQRRKAMRFAQKFNSNGKVFIKDYYYR